MMTRYTFLMGVVVGMVVVAISQDVTAFMIPHQKFSSKLSSKTITTNSQLGLSTTATTETTTTSTSTTTDIDQRTNQKQALLSLLGVQPVMDPILVDPITKENLIITQKGTLLFSSSKNNKVTYELKSPSNTYVGSADSYINLLEPITKESQQQQQQSEDDNGRMLATTLLRTLTPFVPPPLRSIFASSTGTNDYIPMRDLFTSPSVSYAYERGWRQSFASAGFPGPDKETELALEYFAPTLLLKVGGNEEKMDKNILVDMSCATGLFTRRFVKSKQFDRVLGCDYSSSMLEQARAFINNDSELSSSSSSSSSRGTTKATTTQLDLIRLDVGQIPLRNESINALHAGAAMHCWPDLVSAVTEIYRVLKPGGRYFATTFLSSYFRTLQTTENSVNNGGGGTNSLPSQQAFQYFANVEELKSLMIQGGFQPEKIQIEILGRACVVIRCEK